MEVVPHQSRSTGTIRKSRKVGDTDTILSSSMNSWMYENQTNEEMRRAR